MAALVYPAKLLVPRLPATYLARPRLDARWDAWRGQRLVSVAAGAGSGKTTFLAARARAHGARALWYALDEMDRDPAVMAAHLAAACGREGVPSLDELLAAIVAGPERRSFIVFDDVQLVADSADIIAYLARLSRYLADDSLLVLASREPVPVPTARWQSQGLAAHLGSRDLAFTVPEVVALFAQRFGGAPLDLLQAEQLAGLTEGWAAGLEIFCQSLPGPEERHVAATLAEFARGRGGWFDYFVEEVLAALDPCQRSFLVASSVLRRLEPSLCDDVLERRDSGRVLRELARRQLFTYAADDGTYRYHHLFRDCLQDLFAREQPAAAGRRLRRRAAEALRHRGEEVEACLALASAGDAGRALALVKRRADHLLASRQYAALSEIMASLPAAAVRANADTLYVQGYLDLLQGRWSAAESALRRALRLRPAPTRRARISALLAQHLMQTGRWEACLRWGRQALARPGRLASTVRADLLGAMGVSACSLGRIMVGESHLEDARRICRQAGEREGEGRNLFRLAANVHFIRGDFSRAQQAADQALRIFRASGNREMVGHSQGVLGFVLAGEGREREARELTVEALREARGIGYRHIEGYCQLTLGQCDLLAAETRTAAELLTAALATGEDLGERALQTWAILGLAEAAWRAGEPRHARDQSQRALALAVRQRDLFSEARARMWLGRIAAHDHGASAAAPYWDAAERSLQRLGAGLEQARLRLWRLEAAATPPRGATTALMADLASEGRVFLVEKLETAAASHLVSVCPAEETAAVAGLAAKLGILPVTPATDHRAEPRPSLIIRPLGPLVIECGEQVMPPSTWPSARARRLLQYLIVHRFQPLPREQVIEALWPDADPRRSALSLRQAVHLLRGLLGSPSAVRTQAETVQLDPGNDARYDVLEFETLLRRGQAALGGDRENEALRTLRTAVDLYRGGFCADSPYEPFAEEEAGHLRHRFRRTLARLVELLMRRRRWDDVVAYCRRGQADDSLSEDFTCHLVTALLALGHRQEALAECHRFETLYVRELDLLPSPRLKALAERAVSGGR